MYDWLQDSLGDDTCLITANQRLARELRRHFDAQQVAAGQLAWRSPNIRAWHGWLRDIVLSVGTGAVVPVYINPQQSQCLWERCVRQELGETATRISPLARLARDAWQRAADAGVSIRDVARTAASADQRHFAAIAGRYVAILERRGWTDDAALSGVVVELIENGVATLSGRYAFVGFNRDNASRRAVQAALRAAHCGVTEVLPAGRNQQAVRCEFEHRDAEIRAAGQWAANCIAASPGAHVAVIVPGLEQTSDRDARLLRESFCPGWQTQPEAIRNAVNVSYGRRLDEYPAIEGALAVLSWLVRDLRSAEVSSLLLSSFDNAPYGERARLELRVRRMPERGWSPAKVTSALRGDSAGASDWLNRIAALSKQRRELPTTAKPADWVVIFDEALHCYGWPGETQLDSAEYQLLNRWRELLNEFARLELVTPGLSAAAAVSRLRQLANDTVFQAKSAEASVELLGPLEAAGAEFDAVWVCGLNTAHWPPAGRRTTLIARSLQISSAMPDATPEDTYRFAELTLQRIIASSPDVVCSYSRFENDIEQSACDLLDPKLPVARFSDPGWYAGRLLGRATVLSAVDSIPPVSDELVSGGARTIQLQLTEPFAAFAYGRLGIRPLQAQAEGLPPWLRGNLIHDVLFRVYRDFPSSEQLRLLSDEALAQRVNAGAEAVFQRHRRNSDAVLNALFSLEQKRTSELVQRFIDLDRQRSEFDVEALEADAMFRHGTVKLDLRFDRINRFPDGSVEILDYKTGAPKTLVSKNGLVRDIQLFVYSMAVEHPIAALALANVDAREMSFSGAGRGYTDEAAWPELLQSVQNDVGRACEELAEGDVRVNALQGTAAARPLNLLTRFTELVRAG